MSERSGLEQDLGQTVALVKAKRAVDAGQGEAQLYAGDPYGIPTAAPGQPLPAPPVSVRLCFQGMLAFQQNSSGFFCTCSCHGVSTAALISCMCAC